MAIDPICGMTVDEATALRAERDGQTFYFCCEHCRKKFLAGGVTTEAKLAKQATSGKYICPMCAGVESDRPGSCPKCGMALEPARPVAAKRVIYTCPMHPEVQQDHPGSCPKCGMALEPKSIEAAEEGDSELTSMTLRFWVSAALTIPVFLLAMLPMLGVPVDHWLGGTLHSWLQLLLATPVVLWGGWPFFERGARSIVTWNLNMFTLIAVGTGRRTSTASSRRSFRPDSESFKHHGRPEVYFEAAAVIVTLVLLGQVLELRARRRTLERHPRLLSLAAAGPRRQGWAGTGSAAGGGPPGDVLRVRPGEKSLWTAS
jgi:Cu+-exporting ATPase